MATINVFPLGGQDENGKNILVMEINNDIYILNAGNKVPISNRLGVDGIIADFSYLQKNRNRIKGLFITHAHDETFAAIPWLLMEVKGITIYASNFTTKIINERISKYKIGHSDFKVKVLSESQKIGDIMVEAYPIANSIAGSIALNFKAPDGDIIAISNFVNTDLGVYGKTDLDFIASKVHNLLLLITDARRSNYKGEAHTRIRFTELIEKVFKKVKDNNRIILSAYDEEMFTIQQVLDMAYKYKRPVILYGRTFNYLLLQLKNQNPKLNLPKIVKHNEIAKHSNAVVIVTGTWSRLYARLVRIASDNDVFLKLKDTDYFINIAPPVNGLEVEASQSLDEVAKLTPHLLDITDKDYYPTRPTQDDIEILVKKLKPKYFMPIAALYRYLYIAVEAAIRGGITKDRGIILDNGKVLLLKDGKLASQKGRIKEVGETIIDGFGVGDISYAVIRERQTLGAGGAISISVQISRKTKKIVDDINIQFMGIATKVEIKPLFEVINGEVRKKMREAEKFDRREIQNVIRKRIRRVVSKYTNKEPLVIITFIEV